MWFNIRRCDYKGVWAVCGKAWRILVNEMGEEGLAQDMVLRVLKDTDQYILNLKKKKKLSQFQTSLVDCLWHKNFLLW